MVKQNVTFNQFEIIPFITIRIVLICFGVISSPFLKMLKIKTYLNFKDMVIIRSDMYS